MVHAFRSRRPGGNEIGDHQIAITGTYNLEHKVTVEWEQVTSIVDMERLCLRLPDRPYSRAEIRSLISGHFLELDEQLPPTKIGEYRISPTALNDVLRALENSKILTRRGETWVPKKIGDE